MAWSWNPFKMVHDTLFAPAAKALRAPGAQSLGYNDKERADMEALLASRAQGGAQSPQAQALFAAMDGKQTGRFQLRPDTVVQLRDGQIEDVTDPDPKWKKAAIYAAIAAGAIYGGVALAGLAAGGAGAGAGAAAGASTGGTLASTTTTPLIGTGAGLASTAGKWAGPVLSAVSGAAKNKQTADALNDQSALDFDQQSLNEDQFELNRSRVQEGEPRRRMRDAIRASVLKNAQPVRSTWAGPGSGRYGVRFQNALGPELLDGQTREMAASWLDSLQQEQQAGSSRYDFGDRQRVRRDPYRSTGADKALGAANIAAAVLRARYGGSF